MPLPFTYFVKDSTIVGAPANTNDGRDAIGCNLANASYDHTGGASGERQLTAASGSPFNFVLAGDYIYLLNAVGGIADGLYRIASKATSAIVLLVADSGLTADSTADVDSSNGPWKTIQYGFDNTTTTGDQLVICDDGDATVGTDWEPTVTLDIDTNQGGASGIHVRGANSRGVVDGVTKATISGASLGATTSLITITTMDSWRFYDLRITGATSHNVNAGNNAQVDHRFYRCRIDGAVGASSDGVAFEGDGFRFIDCEVDGNGRDGLRVNTANRGVGLKVLRCSLHGNTGSGLFGGGAYYSLLESHFYRNGGDGYAINRVCPQLEIDGCTFFFNTGDGVGVYSSFFALQPGSIHNSIFRSNGAWGVSLATFTTAFIEVSYCCFHNNTSGAMDTAGQGVVPFPGIAPGTDTNIYVDPLFTSEVPGSENFTLRPGSPIINAGISVATA